MKTSPWADGRLVIMADYDCYCWVGEDGTGSDLDLLFPDTPGIPELMKDFSRWVSQFTVSYPESDGRIRNVDWEKFHHEGIGLCHRLKKIVGDTYEIYYWTPYENPNSDQEVPILIMTPDEQGISNRENSQS